MRNRLESRRAKGTQSIAVRWLLALLLVALAFSVPAHGLSLLGLTISLSPLSKLDPLAQSRAVLLTGGSRVIVRAVDVNALAALVPLIQQLGGTIRRTLGIINAHAIELPNVSLLTLAALPGVERISLDRLAAGTMERTGATVGAAAVREALGYDGTGVGVAILDSGITSWHDDLAASDGGQRVDRFVDFVSSYPLPYDDYGHGTHVAGIVAGDGFDSGGARMGIAPGARLIVLKVLDRKGQGYISDVIAALDYVLLNHSALNIRVANLSIAAGVYESYTTDPLTRAAREVVEAGVVVVAAAGNHGRNPNGREAYGGVASPGNAPWVLTVGASSHRGTLGRADDGMAAFSSRGPTAVDHSAKPDLVAPGVGLESLSDPDSRFYSTKSKYLLDGTVPTGYRPYLSLSGTSMAAPVVAGTVALMLQANPALTPNAVKAMLQFTSQVYPDYDPLTQGAGFLDAAGAVALARAFADPTAPRPSSSSWGGRVIWGNQLMRGGHLPSDAPEWSTSIEWGAQPVEWHGWTEEPSNVVWGSRCGGADCQESWSVSAASADESVVWGTDAESVVWGTAASDESVVWGTDCSDPSCEPIVWNEP